MIRKVMFFGELWAPPFHSPWCVHFSLWNPLVFDVGQIQTLLMVRKCSQKFLQFFHYGWSFKPTIWDVWLWVIQDAKKETLITLSFFLFFYPHYNLSMDPLPTTSTCRSHYKIQTYKLTFGYPVTITEFNHKVLKTMYLKSLDLIGVIPRDVHLHPPYALFILFL